jgi:hypothetical protein
LLEFSPIKWHAGKSYHHASRGLKIKGYWFPEKYVTKNQSFHLLSRCLAAAPMRTFTLTGKTNRYPFREALNNMQKYVTPQDLKATCIEQPHPALR